MAEERNRAVPVELPQPESIDALPDVAAALQGQRAQAALAKENEAVVAEINARQWELVAAANPADVNGQQQFINAKARAERVRGEAEKMHALAGTNRMKHKQNVLTNLKGNIVYYQTQLLGAQDAEENPDAYGESAIPVVVAQAMLIAHEEKIKEVEGWK